MAERAASRLRSQDDAIAGEVIRVGASRLVPVLQRRVGVSRIARPSAWSGFADCRLIGVWVVPRCGSPHFLPAEANPPGDAADWNAWLSQSPALLASIAARLVAGSGAPG